MNGIRNLKKMAMTAAADRYEKSFLEVMNGLEQELFQLSVGDILQDRNQKKSHGTIR